MFRFSFLFSLLFCCIAISYTQAGEKESHQLHIPPKPTSLLWRISGMGLAKPSYLYGTIHLQDKRVFRFADSVLLALESCSLFAAEVRLDTLVSEIIEMMYDTTKGKRLKDVLTQKELDSLTPIISEALSIPPRSVPKLRAGVLHYFFTSGLFRRVDKDMILDAYLLGLARTLRKSLHALEPLSNQINAFDNLSLETLRKSSSATPLEKLRKQLQREHLIQLYDIGNVDSIYNFMSAQMGKGEADTLLALRNHYMARSVDSLSRIAPVFATMGVAHLGGSEGVITLLRQMGYTLEPVIPTYTGMAQRYDSIDITKSATWYTYTSEKNGFSVKMPAKLAEAPLYKQMYGSLEMEMPMASDIISGNFFMVMSLRLPNRLTKDETVRYMDEVAGRLLPSMIDKNTDTLPRSIITHKGVTGYEYSGIGIAGANYRIRGFVRNTGAYILVLQGNSRSIKTAVADTFMASLNFLSTKRPDWMPFSDSAAAITLSFPGKPLQAIDQDGNLLTSYYSSDASSGITFSFTWNTLSEPFNQRSQKSYVRRRLLQYVYKYVSDSLKNNVRYDTLPDGSFRARYRFYNKESDVQSIGEYIIRGKRLYDLVFSSSDNQSYSADSTTFFSSVRFLPFQRFRDWKEYTCPVFPLRAQFPSQPFLDTTSSEDFASVYPTEVAWYLNEPSTGNNYTIYVSEYSPYFEIPKMSDSALCSYLMTPTKSVHDTVISKKVYRKGTILAAEYIVAKKYAPYSKRLHYYYLGNKLYSVSSLLHNNDLESENTLRFFNSVTITDTSSVYDYGTQGTKKWLEDILSHDSAHQNRAIKALQWIRFDSTEVSYIYQALTHKSFPSDTLLTTAQHYSAIRFLLLSRLGQFLDSVSVNSLRHLYLNYKPYPTLQNQILSFLSYKKNTEATAALVDLFCTNTPSKDTTLYYHQGYFLLSLRDSLHLLKPHLSQLMQLLKHREYKPILYELWREAYEHKVITLQEFAEKKNMIYADLQKEWKNYSRSLRYPEKRYYDKDDPNSESYEVFDRMSGSIIRELCLSLSFLNYDKQKEQVLHTITREAQEKDNSLLFNATVSLLRWNKRPSNSTILTLCKDDYWAADIIRLLDSTSKQELLPPSYRTQYAAAIAYFKEYMYDSDEYIDTVELVKSIYISNDSLNGMFYLVCYNDQHDSSDKKAWTTALIGCFPRDTTALSLIKDCINAFGKRLDAFPPDEHINFLLKEPDYSSYLYTEDD